MYLDLIEKKRKKKELNTTLTSEKIRKFKPTKMNSFEIQKILQEFINDLDIKNSFYPKYLMTVSNQFKIQIIKQQIKVSTNHTTNVQMTTTYNNQTTKGHLTTTTANKQTKQKKHL